MAAQRVNVPPAMLRWARQRSGRSVEDLIGRFPKLTDWEAGRSSPAISSFPGPPEETLPIPDFRIFAGSAVLTPTPDLLDTIYACEQRQEWYREYAEATGAEPVEVVGSLSLDTNVLEAAARLRDVFGFTLARRVEFSTWTAALDGLREHAEDVGVLVMINGVVGSNTHRRLNPEEFRGFALVDELAPLVFINGADTKAAQVFTLAHELAHVALGGSAISKPDLGSLVDDGQTERWCNRVAAELLVPLGSLTEEYEPSADLGVQLARLAKYYKVSTLVILRRIYDAGFIEWQVYRSAYAAELDRLLALVGEGSPGGNFYNTQPVRVSKRFARALISDTIEGRTLHRDAFRLLGFKKFSTFEELGHRLGIA